MRISNWLKILILMLISSMVARAETPAAMGTGSIRCEIWHHLDGQQITDTLEDQALLAKPDETRSLDDFELNPGPEEPDACALRGYLIPPATGDYKLMIAADDTALLYLSKDETVEKRTSIASVPAALGVHDYTHYAAQTSKPISLVAGKRYFVEALMKNASGPGSVSVAWTMPDGKVEAPIPGNRLMPATAVIPAPSLKTDPPKLTLKPENPQSAKPGFHKFQLGAHIEWPKETVDISYLIYLPQKFDTTDDQRPLLVFLHGNTHQGTSLWGVLNEGPANYLMNNTELFAWFPMIGLFPQLPPDWRWDRPGAAQAVNALVKAVCDKYPRIDRKRIYLTGLSMGGKGTWLTVLDSPETYTAIATMSAVAVRPQQAKVKLAGLKDIRILCGADDIDFADGSRQMFDALQPVMGDRVQFTAVEHMGHSVWTRYYNTQEFYEELMRYSK